MLLFQVDEKMIKTFGEQIFHTGFVHGDPHPGNGRFVVTTKDVYLAA